MIPSSNDIYLRLLDLYSKGRIKSYPDLVRALKQWQVNCGRA